MHPAPRTAALAAALAGAAVPALAAPAAPDVPRLGDAMVSRPLFAPSRRPPPAPVPEEAPEPPAAAPLPAPPPAMSLSGVIATPGGGVALLRRPQDAAPLRVVRGGDLDGWTLAEVRPRAVVLVRDGRSVTLELSAGGL